MTLQAMITRCAANVEDQGLRYYLQAEVIDKLNTAKDIVMSFVRNFTSQRPTGTTTISFAAGTKTANLPSTFLEIKRIAKVKADGTMEVIYDVDSPQYENNTWATKFAIEWDTTGQAILSRNFVDDALSLQVKYISNVADFTSSDLANSFTFGPDPTNTLIIIEATCLLLASRKRVESEATFRRVADRLYQSLMLNLQTTNKASARYVHRV